VRTTCLQLRRDGTAVDSEVAEYRFQTQRACVER